MYIMALKQLSKLPFLASLWCQILMASFTHDRRYKCKSFYWCTHALRCAQPTTHNANIQIVAGRCSLQNFANLKMQQAVAANCLAREKYVLILSLFLYIRYTITLSLSYTICNRQTHINEGTFSQSFTSST